MRNTLILLILACASVQSFASAHLASRSVKASARTANVTAKQTAHLLYGVGKFWF